MTEPEVTTCPRVASKEQIIAGLKQGGVCYIDRKDAPELQDLLELVEQGFVETWLEEIEEQYSRRGFRWKSSYGAVENAETTPSRHPDLDEPPMGSTEFQQFVREEKGK